MTSPSPRSNDRPGFPAEVRLLIVNVDEVGLELRAQIDTGYAAGLTPAHLGWHCPADGGRADRPAGLRERAVHPAIGDQASRAMDPGRRVRHSDYEVLISPQVRKIVRREAS